MSARSFHDGTRFYREKNQSELTMIRPKFSVLFLAFGKVFPIWQRLNVRSLMCCWAIWIIFVLRSYWFPPILSDNKVKNWIRKGEKILSSFARCATEELGWTNNSFVRFSFSLLVDAQFHFTNRSSNQVMNFNNQINFERSKSTRYLIFITQRNTRSTKYWNENNRLATIRLNFVNLILFFSFYFINLKHLKTYVYVNDLSK